MSHFSTVKTQIRDLDALKGALSDLGIDWKPGPQTVRGYQAPEREAEVVIEQNNGCDVGFCWNGQVYELVADLQYWQQPWSVNGFLERVNQGYAYRTILDTVAQQGFDLAERQQNEDGSIRVVVQRWSG
ncbi:MAG: hypothetical protein BRC58_03505 [Cyanobacteria bacterium QS_8_64_29]|nr:MAG: hypothetical protein BRC58_03505 [Cyanobacteria bacterium QS_8_64_29]